MTASDPRSRLLALLEGSNAVKQGWSNVLAERVLAFVADEMDAAADALDTEAVELWRLYTSAPPSDSRRADPLTEGQSDGWENAATAVRDRAAALRSQP